MEKIFDIAKDSEKSWGVIAQGIDGNFEEVNTEIDINKGNFEVVSSEEKIIYPKDDNNIGFYNNNGTFSGASSTGYRYQEIIVNENDIIAVTDLNETEGGRATFKFLCAYDVDGNAITDKGISNVVTREYIVPKGISKVIISYNYAYESCYKITHRKEYVIAENKVVTRSIEDNAVTENKLENKLRKCYIMASDTQEEILCKLIDAYKIGNVDVVWEFGDYLFDQEVFDLIESKYKLRGHELPIGGGCRYWFNNSKVTLHYTGTNVDINEHCNLFGCTSTGGNYELHDAILHNINGCYVVHDDPGAVTKGYVNKYNNIHFVSEYEKMDNALSKCIGGGLALSSNIVIEGCTFRFVGERPSGGDKPYTVTYHAASNDSYGELHGYINFAIKNSYIPSFRVGQLLDRQQGRLIFCGNKYKEYLNSNCEEYKFCNEMITD